ncbi:hypothetical protein COLO4_35464 [Corchorus olitorius]|uniref:Uncharacterized protein n=1 Tax=Corchorus olitorius TaxID=93759 RepID=A0A1R3GGQ3_9ROSI|nr:hypothetical protein COLO4_35464 [Corchorus olitorius]
MKGSGRQFEIERKEKKIQTKEKTELAIQLEPMRALQQGINSLLFPV